MPGTPTTLLFIAANPATTTRLALDEEARLIEQELGMCPSQDTFRIRALWAARPIELLRGINRDRPAIVHFAGHADARGLMLADDHEGHVAVSGANLSHLLSGMSGVTRLVVLNACLTDEQSQALVNAVGCVIAMLAPIGDVDARRFSQALYAALAQGQSVHSAFEQAAALLVIHCRSAIEPRDVVAIGENAPFDDRGPTLRTRPDVDAKSLCFLSEPRSGVRAWRQLQRRHAFYIAFLGIVCALAVMLMRIPDEHRISTQVARLPGKADQQQPAVTRLSSEAKPNSNVDWTPSDGDPAKNAVANARYCRHVRINDISVRIDGLAVVVDMTMHNIGSRNANVTRIHFTKAIPRDQLGLQHAVEPPNEYPLIWSKDSNELIISHTLRPDEVDRIVVRIHPNVLYAGSNIATRIFAKYNRFCSTDAELLEFTVPGATKARSTPSGNRTSPRL